MKKLLIYALLAVIIHTTGYSQASNDSAMIRQVLNRESETWRAGDVKGHADCWKIQPYSRILISTTEGKVYDMSPSMMINPPPAMFGNGGTFSVSDMKMSIIGNSAWVNFSEESTSKDGHTN